MRVALLVLASLASCTLIRPPRQLALDGQEDCRDLGGYRTDDGRRVAWGSVYRSANLTKLSARDQDLFRKLGVRVVLDLRPGSPARPDVPEGTRVVRVPVAAYAQGGHSAEYHRRVFRGLVEEGKEAFAATLRTASDGGQRPMIIHGGAGIHRTAAASAVLLSALGVPWKTVRKDYVLSNKFRKKITKEGIRAVPKSQRRAAKAYYVLEPEYLDAFRDEVLRRYGSMEGYLMRGLGLTRDELSALRTSLLL